jgi:DNA-binding transcriptional ArsR family regulator
MPVDYSTKRLTVSATGAIFNHMVDRPRDRKPAENKSSEAKLPEARHPDRLDAVFHALADPTRRQMLRTLASGERSVGELASPFRMSLAGASKHVKALERGGLVRRSVQGRTHICRLEPAPLAAAEAWLQYYAHFWNQSLAALDAALRGPDALDAALRQEDAARTRSPRKAPKGKGPSA